MWISVVSYFRRFFFFFFSGGSAPPLSSSSRHGDFFFRFLRGRGLRGPFSVHWIFFFFFFLWLSSMLFTFFFLHVFGLPSLPILLEAVSSFLSPRALMFHLRTVEGWASFFFSFRGRLFFPPLLIELVDAFERGEVVFFPLFCSKRHCVPLGAFSFFPLPLPSLFLVSSWVVFSRFRGTGIMRDAFFFSPFHERGPQIFLFSFFFSPLRAFP